MTLFIGLSDLLAMNSCARSVAEATNPFDQAMGSRVPVPKDGDEREDCDVNVLHRAKAFGLMCRIR